MVLVWIRGISVVPLKIKDLRGLAHSQHIKHDNNRSRSCQTLGHSVLGFSVHRNPMEKTHHRESPRMGLFWHKHIIRDAKDIRPLSTPKRVNRCPIVSLGVFGNVLLGFCQSFGKNPAETLRGKLHAVSHVTHHLKTRCRAKGTICVGRLWK